MYRSRLPHSLTVQKQMAERCAVSASVGRRLRYPSEALLHLRNEDSLRQGSIPLQCVSWPENQEREVLVGFLNELTHYWFVFIVLLFFFF